MKKVMLRRILAGMISGAVIMMLLSSCSGVIGGETSVLIRVPGLASNPVGRHVSGNAVNGFVVVLKKNSNSVYSLNRFDGSAFHYLVNGQVYITNLPPGEYLFGISLKDSQDDNVGFSLKEFTIRKGFNDISLLVAPGIRILNIEGITGDLTNPFDPPEGVSMFFAEDTLIIDYNRPATPLVTFEVSFGDGTTINANTPTAINGNPPTGSGSSYRVAADSDGISWTYDATFSGSLQEYEYRIILQ